jgi:hypothetical protein
VRHVGYMPRPFASAGLRATTRGRTRGGRPARRRRGRPS